jgi:hypothetical protein
MATIIYKNAYFEVNGTSLSDHVESLTFNYGSEMQDETAMGDDTRINKGGLKTWSLDINFHQDYAAADVDGKFFSLVGTTACYEWRPQNICSTAINPRFSGIGVVDSYQPQGGSVGSLLDAPVTIQSASDVARAITAT